MPIFSRSEIRRRIDAVTARMHDLDIDVALLHTADNVYYATGVPLLSGWGRPMWAVVWADGHVAIIGAMIERETMEAYGQVNEVRAYDDKENVWEASLRTVADLIGSRGSPPARIGIERPFIPLGPRMASPRSLPPSKSTSCRPSSRRG